MKAIITKLQDMQPLYLDATKESYIMKLETNKYVIVHSFFDNELRIIDLLELKWFLKECKDDQAITDLEGTYKGITKKDIVILPLSKYSSYSEYLEFAVNNEVLEVKVKKEVIQEKTTMTKKVMEVLFLLKKELTNIQETINQVINFSIQALDYSFVVLTALILSLFFSSKVNLETNKDSKTTVLSFSKNVPSAKRFYFVLKLVNLSFITYLVTIKGLDNLLIG